MWSCLFCFSSGMLSPGQLNLMFTFLYICPLLGFSETFLEATRWVSGLFVHKLWRESWPFGVGGRPVISMPLLCSSSTQMEKWQKLGWWRLNCPLDLDRGSEVEGRREDCSQDTPCQMRVWEEFSGLCVVCTLRENGRPACWRSQSFYWPVALKLRCPLLDPVLGPCLVER